MTLRAVPARTPRRTARQTQEHVLAVAQQLFYWEGVRATGVDRVAEVAQVAPTALYRAFGSKDGLVAAYVAANAAGYRSFIEDQTAPRHGPAEERILRLFDEVLVQVQPDVCRGCPFLMTLSEFPDPANEAHQIAVETKRWVRAHLSTLVEELSHEMSSGTDGPAHRDRPGEGVGGATARQIDQQAVAQLADQLALVLEGVYASVQALTAAGPPAQARSAAAVLLNAFRARAAS